MDPQSPSNHFHKPEERFQSQQQHFFLGERPNFCPGPLESATASNGVDIPDIYLDIPHLRPPDWDLNFWFQECLSEWRIVEPKLMCMYPIGRSADKVCPYIPRNVFQWIQHCWDTYTMEQTTAKCKVRPDKGSPSMFPPNSLLFPAFNGRLFGNRNFPSQQESSAQASSQIKSTTGWEPSSRGYVLAQKTIWSPQGPNLRGDHAAWPSRAELEWEGDLRVASENGRFGRYLPLPRIQVEGDSIAWNLKRRLSPSAFDDIWAIPTKKDPEYEIECPTVISHLLNREILVALDMPTLITGANQFSIL